MGRLIVFDTSQRGKYSLPAFPVFTAVLMLGIIEILIGIERITKGQITVKWYLILGCCLCRQISIYHKKVNHDIYPKEYVCILCRSLKFGSKLVM